MPKGVYKRKKDEVVEGTGVEQKEAFARIKGRFVSESPSRLTFTHEVLDVRLPGSCKAAITVSWMKTLGAERVEQDEVRVRVKDVVSKEMGMQVRFSFVKES